MKATLVFSLPEESVEHRDALQGSEAKMVLWEIDQRCRSMLKHGEPCRETADVLQEIRDMIPFELMAD